jgi:hypothetical protein
LATFVSNALQWVAQQFFKGNADQKLNALHYIVAGVYRDAIAGVSGAWWLVTRIADEAKNDQGYVVNAVSNLGASMADLRITIRHVYDTIIPNTTKLALWYVYWTWIYGIHIQLRSDEGLISDNANAISALDKWQAQKVDPMLGSVLNLFGWLGGADKFPPIYGNKNAKDALSDISYLFSAFHVFAGWMLNRYQDGNGNWHAGQLTEWLSSQDNRGALDDLLQTLITYSPDHFRYIERAAVAVIESPYP